MVLNEITLKNFRNYNNEKIIFSEKINIILGNNAQGKTNLLEAIYFLGTTKSHRAHLDQTLIKETKKDLKVSGVFKKSETKEMLEITIKDGKKQLKSKKKIINSMGEYIDKTKILIFSPEDLNIIKEGPEIRRDYIDFRICQIEKNYNKLMLDYNKLLKIRNEYIEKIKNNIFYNEKYYQIITEYYIKKSTAIYSIRKKYIDKINDYAEEIYLNLSGNKRFKIKYKINFEIIEEYENSLRKILLENKEKEKNYGKTLYGVHRDDLEFYLEGKNLKNFGSQGQQRMAIISFKLSELEILKKYTEDVPILLLDDVFSELDNEKQEKLIKYIDKKMQVFISTTDIENINFKLLKNARIFNISEGSINILEEKNGR